MTRMLGDKFTFTGTKPRDTMHLKFGKIVCFVAAFCAATAVVAAAQTLTTLVRFDKTDGSYVLGTDPFDRPHEWVRNRFAQDIKSHGSIRSVLF